MYFANYQNLYEKALVPIGMNDRNALLQHSIDHSHATHWLIALEEQRDENPIEQSSWKVILFQANEDGYCLWKKPTYVSQSYQCFHKAYEAAKDLETYSRADDLFPSYLLDPIC